MATTAAAISAEMAKGFLEGKQALVDLALETANAVGQIAALERNWQTQNQEHCDLERV